jgi:hypothetical protein
MYCETEQRTSLRNRSSVSSDVCSDVSTHGLFYEAYMLNLIVHIYNAKETKRRLTKEYKNTIDWSQNVTLEDETFTTVTAYDALNRATNIKAPHNNIDTINEILPAYDEGGLLKGVKAKLRGSTEETDFVTKISYNPKGQRTRIKYGNGATTKYAHDKNNFRLTRLWTFRNNGTENL